MENELVLLMALVVMQDAQRFGAAAALKLHTEVTQDIAACLIPAAGLRKLGEAVGALTHCRAYVNKVRC